jgi:hemoglobin-like flavoprotein
MDLSLLQQTFDRAQKENGGTRALGLRFYARLFEKYPQVKPLFNTPPEEQHKKLMASLGVIVAGAGNTETLIPYLRAMAIRHIDYGTENAHYPAVAENLVAVLEEHLSKEGDFTPAMKTSWEQALTLIGGIMTETASNPQAYAQELAHAGYEANGQKTKK